MSVVELPIDHDEWQRIRDVSLAAGIDDLVNPPVLVHTHPGSGEAPHWRVWSQDGTVVEVRHDLPANRPLKVALPGKAIFHGMHLAAREGSCSLVLDGGYQLPCRLVPAQQDLSDTRPAICGEFAVMFKQVAAGDRATKLAEDGNRLVALPDRVAGIRVRDANLDCVQPGKRGEDFQECLAVGRDGIRTEQPEQGRVGGRKLGQQCQFDSPCRARILLPASTDIVFQWSTDLGVLDSLVLVRLVQPGKLFIQSTLADSIKYLGSLSKARDQRLLQRRQPAGRRLQEDRGNGGVEGKRSSGSPAPEQPCSER